MAAGGRATVSETFSFDIAADDQAEQRLIAESAGTISGASQPGA